MTDHSTVTRLVDYASDLVYDAGHNLCYVSIGKQVFTIDPVTGQTTLLLTVPGDISSLALSPDGSHLLVGLFHSTDYSDPNYQRTLVDVPMATASDPTTFNITHYFFDDVHDLGDAETNVFDLVITPDNQVLMTTDYAGSGNIAFRDFPLGTTGMLPDTRVPGLAMVNQKTALIPSEHGRYIFIEQGNISNAPIAIYDTQLHQVIAATDFNVIHYTTAFNAGLGDISETAGMAVDIVGVGVVVVFDLNLHVVKDLTGTFPYSIINAKFSLDGKLLYLWEAGTHHMLMYDTATWTYQGHVDIDVSGGASRFMSGGSGHMFLSDDGSVMFMVGNRTVEAVDLFSRTHFEQQGTAGNDTLTSAQYGDELYGKGGNDHLVGNGGDDHLSGGDGNDILDGGAGSDTVLYDTAGAALTVDLTITAAQQTGQGKDTLIGVENITGGAFNDFLTGDSHNNTLDGGAGVDILTGGLGNDTYVVDDPTDVIIEHKASGIDTVIASFDYTLGSDLENLTITGTEARLATGNSAANTLTGTTEANIIDGKGGADVMIGGDGDDRYVVDNSHDVIVEYRFEGDHDSVTASADYTLSDFVENLTLTGGAIMGAGNDEDNIITGTDANNQLYGGGGDDSLDGGLGADVMSGGTGHDRFFIDNPGDVVTEDAGGHGFVSTFFDYTLSANIDNAVLNFGSGNGRTLTGNNGDNRLFNFGGANTLDGGAGADYMQGDGWSEVFIVDNSGDIVIDEEMRDQDLVLSSVSYVLIDEVENLTLTGTAAIDGTGGNFDNVLTGNASDNILMGLRGDDTLIGGGGHDSLMGGLGNDTYVIDLTGDIVTENAGEGNDSENVSISYSLDANIESLILAGSGNIDGTGNELANVITGNAGNNRLDGGLGADVLSGGGGDDTYIVDSSDTVSEDDGAGTDTIVTAIAYTLGVNLENLTLTGTAKISGTGNGLDNVIIGNDVRNTLIGGDGNDTLSGGKGIDTMIGGAGNDTYYVDNVAEIVTELHGGGSDTVYSSSTFTLSADVEKLILTGTANTIATGNSLNNTLIGNDGNNKLLGGDGNDTLGGGLGNDTLDGGKGIDGMKGGAGDDKYYLDTSADLVTEYSNGGNDTVQINGTYTLTANVENLIIVGSSNRFGTGNASDNHITGNSGNNTLGGADGNDIIDGGKGADLMRGGTGDDIFYVDNSGDVVSEYSHAGTDSVFSSVSFTLGGNVENLTLTGKGNLSATGNSLDNLLIGNAGDNTLTGGKGADTFVFASNSGVDTISDFSAAQGDRIDLSAYHIVGTSFVSQLGNDTVIDLGDGNVITLTNTTVADVSAHTIW